MGQIIDITKVKKGKEKKKQQQKEVILTLNSRPIPEYLDRHMEIESFYASFLNMASETMNMHLQEIPFISSLSMDTDLVCFHRFVESYVDCKAAMNKTTVKKATMDKATMIKAGADKDSIYEAEPMFKYAFRYSGKDVDGNNLLAFDLYEKHEDDVERSLLLVRHLKEDEDVQLYSWQDDEWISQDPDTLSGHPQVFFSREEEREMYMAFMAAFPDAEEDTYGEFYNQNQLLMFLKRMLAEETRFIVINDQKATDPHDKNVHIALASYNPDFCGMAINLKGDSFEVRRYLNAEQLNDKGYHLHGGLNEVAFRSKDMEKIFHYALRYWDHALSCQDFFQFPLTATSIVEVGNLEDLSRPYLDGLDTTGKVTEKLKKRLAETEERVKKLVDPEWKAGEDEKQDS